MQMISKSAMISGLIGAGIATAVAYFVDVPDEVNKSELNTASNQSLDSSAVKPCPEQAAHAIDWKDAQDMVAAYVDSLNPTHLTYDGTNTLKGWYIERCVIEELFNMYPNADGLQLYVGLKENESNKMVNELVWMASQLTTSGGVTIRENCISLPLSVIDHAKSCPTICADKNDLP